MDQILTIVDDFGLISRNTQNSSSIAVHICTAILVSLKGHPANLRTSMLTDTRITNN